MPLPLLPSAPGTPRGRAAVLLTGLALVLPVATATPAAAVAPGCTAGAPTWIGGAVHGYPDNRSVNAIIGYDLKVTTSTSRTQVNRDGSRFTGRGYSWSERVNPSLSASGSTQQLDRSWGTCVAGNINEVFLEVYPRNPQGVTDKTRYGSTSHYYQPIRRGATNEVLLRLPARAEAGGNTGSINGYITYAGRRVDPARVSRRRVWAVGRGPDCGVEGFSANVEQIAYASGRNATYYRFEAIAGGRCGAATQPYSVEIECLSVCGGAKRILTRRVEVRTGQATRADFAF